MIEQEEERQRKQDEELKRQREEKERAERERKEREEEEYRQRKEQLDAIEEKVCTIAEIMTIKLFLYNNFYFDDFTKEINKILHLSIPFNQLFDN